MYEIILYVVNVVMILLACLIYYKSAKDNIKSLCVELIEKAEIEGMVGSEKMELVVDTLYKHVPTVLKPFINKNVIQVIAQTVFDNIEAYAKKQVDKVMKDNG